MTRHSFRWAPLAFGAMFLAAVGQWAVWKANLLNPDEMAYIAAGLLIAFGILGIVASVMAGRSTPAAPPPPQTTDREESDGTEETDPQS